MCLISYQIYHVEQNKRKNEELIFQLNIMSCYYQFSLIYFWSVYLLFFLKWIKKKNQGNINFDHSIIKRICFFRRTPDKAFFFR